MPRTSAAQQQVELLSKLVMLGEIFLPAILDELNEQTVLLEQIAADLAPVPLTASAPILVGEKMANNVYSMNVGQSQAGVITPFLADGVTPSGGVVSNTVVTFSDPSATFVLASDNVTITFTGVAASTGAVSGTAAFTVTDTNGAVSNITDDFTVTVNAVSAPPLTASAPIVVGAATP